jgi:hypothetical protein
MNKFQAGDVLVWVQTGYEGERIIIIEIDNGWYTWKNVSTGRINRNSTWLIEEACVPEAVYDSPLYKALE